MPNCMKWLYWGDDWMNKLTPVVLLVTRFYVAYVFFLSGLSKTNSWSSTLSMFEYEFAVPLLPPAVAAWMATVGELVLPVMLVLGLFTRFSAIGLFIINAVATISYPDISPAGVKEHYLWGFMLLMVIMIGNQKLVLDQWIKYRFMGSQ